MRSREDVKTNPSAFRGTNLIPSYATAQKLIIRLIRSTAAGQRILAECKIFAVFRNCFRAFKNVRI